MKIGILGGTGDLGRGLALRWCRSHDIVIGSRDVNRGKTVANDYLQAAKSAYGTTMRGSLSGAANSEAASAADVVVLALPYQNVLPYVRTLRNVITPEKTVVSPVVPWEKADHWYRYDPYPGSILAKEGTWYTSMAENFAVELSSQRVVAAFHTLPADKLVQLQTVLDYDVLLAGNDREAVNIVASLTREIPNLRPLYVGPLAAASQLEALVPLLRNISVKNRIKAPSIKIVQ